jgi:hypothetical protein
MEHIEIPIDFPIGRILEVPLGMPIGTAIEIPIDFPIGVILEMPIGMSIGMAIEIPIEMPIEVFQLPTELTIVVSIGGSTEVTSFVEVCPLHSSLGIDTDIRQIFVRLPSHPRTYPVDLRW